MHQSLSASVPRRLRVRASLTLGAKRIPLRSFILGAAICTIGIVALIGGADMTATLWWGGASSVAGLIVLEGRWWGRDSRQIMTIIVRQLRRSRTLRIVPRTYTLPSQVEPSNTSVSRKPRWDR